MAATTQLQVIQPAQGDQLIFGDILMNRLVRTSDTPSQVSVQEWTVAPHHLGAPPHTHQHEDEVFYVLEGEMTVMQDDSVATVGAGSYVVLPRGHLHGFWNSGDAPARMLVILTPGQAEAYFDAAAQYAPTDAPHDLEGVMRVSAEYGMKFRMDLLPEIMMTYKLQTVVPAPPPDAMGG
jgi:quercetin dioxygenase-like cupin family protein